MKKITFLFTATVTLLISGSLFAQKVSLDEALKAGLNFYKNNARNLNPEKSTQTAEIYQILKTSTGENAVYVINFGTDGYALVSANKVAIPVLAYSDEGSFDINNMAPATENWLSNYVEQFEILYTQKAMPSTKTLEMWDKYLQGNFSNAKASTNGFEGRREMLKTKWDQGRGYNYYCPLVPPNYTGHSYDNRCLTGCVATAIAQVLKYHSYPDRGMGILLDDNSRKDITFDTIFDWGIMPNKLSIPSNMANYGEDIKAVANVMYRAGVIVRMHWGADKSGTNYPEAFYYNNRPYNKFVNNLGYRTGVEYVERIDIPDNAKWNFLIMRELDLNRPVLYDGAGEDFDGKYIGHAFVCDGYQTDEDINLFHFNWGWSGSNDGYYFIDVFAVGNEINNAIQFPKGQGAIFNFAPGGERSLDYPYCKGKLIMPFTEGKFDNGSSPNLYHKNTNCQWLLTVDNIKGEILEKFDSLKISFNSFATTEGEDILRIYDGVDETGVLLGEFSGHRKPAPISITGKNLYFTFTTQNNQDRGWEIKYELILKGDPISIENETLSNINIYPNPVSDVLKINGLAVNNKVKIFDVYGKELLNETKFKTNEINISNLAAGIYFVKVENANETKTLKFVKQ